MWKTIVVCVVLLGQVHLDKILSEDKPSFEDTSEEK